MSHRRIHSLRTDSGLRFARFVIAGTGGFIVQIGMLAVLHSVLGVNYLVATAIAVEAAILANFAWHYRWTWRDRAGSWRDQLVRFNALNAITSIFGSIFLTAVFVEVVGLQVVSANIASVAALSVINFIGANTLVFRAAAMLAVVMLAASASSAQASNLEATLQAKTIRDFAKYVASVEGRRAREIEKGEPFLDIERLSADQRPDDRRQLPAQRQRFDFHQHAVLMLLVAPVRVQAPHVTVVVALGQRALLRCAGVFDFDDPGRDAVAERTVGRDAHVIDVVLRVVNDGDELGSPQPQKHLL